MTDVLDRPQEKASAAARWAVLALLTGADLWLGARWIPGRAEWMDGGVLFAAYLCLAGWLLVAAGAWARGSLRGLGWPALLLSPAVAWLFYAGTKVSSQAMVNFGAIPYFSAGTLLWAALSAEKTGPGPGPEPRAWRWAALLLLAGAALGALLFVLRNWTHDTLRWPEDKTSVDMLLVGRDGGGATDIAGGPFAQESWLWVAGLWALGVAGVVAFGARLGEKALLWSLFAAAMLGKFAMAGLSTQGLSIIATKIASINTNYFAVAAQIDGPYSFLRDFNAHQATAGFHVNTHPPLPVLVYWLLWLLLFKSPFAAALVIMALSAAAVWPLYRLGEGMGGEGGGLAMAALFVTSPLNLILGNAGIDSVVFTLVALTVWRLWKAATAGGWGWPFAAGVSLGIATLNSFGSSSSLVFLGTWGLLLLWRGRRSLADFAVRNAVVWTAFSAGLLAVHGALWALSLGHFHYMESVRTAQFVHLSANQYRPFELWSWANVILYTGYTGLGLAALWLARVGGDLFMADTTEPASMASAAVVLTLVLSAYGRAEVQRQYLFAGVFLLPAAAAALPRGKDGRVQGPPLAAALALNVVSAVLLQMYVLDYW